MKKIYLFTLLILSFWITKAQDFSNKGKDFWIGYGNHVKMYATDQTQADQMALYITSDVNTTGTVSISGIFSQNFTVTANQIIEIAIPRSARLLKDGLSNYGIHVTSAKAVVVYAHIYASAVSGATVCLPTNTLGKEYYSINYTQKSNEDPSYSYFFVIATEDNTTVQITPAQATIGGWAAGSVNTVTLNTGQVYQVLANKDLTGSTIKSIANGTGSCKRIAVYSGSGKVYINTPENIGCTTADNLFQQVYPTNTWGKKYITVPSSGRPLNIYRVVKSSPAAQVYVNGTVIPAGSFTNNLYYEFYNSTTNVIESDMPIMVAQYFPTQSCNSNGGGNGTKGTYNDPEMIFINPVEQTIRQVTLNSTKNFLIQEQYINIAVKNEGAALSSMRLDGSPIANYFSTLPQDSKYSYAQIYVEPGTHNLNCDSGFNAIAYGMGDHETYGYSAGTNLVDLYQYITIKNTYATVKFPAACKDDPFQFYNVFPYQPLSLKYLFNGLFNDTTINSPVYDSTWTVGTRTLYRYKLDRYYTVHTPATYPISVIANNPTVTNGCTGEQEIDYDLEVFDKPKADFSYNFSGCFKDMVSFKEIVDPNNSRQIILTRWDMGHGKIIDTTGPNYVFKAIGDSVVKYSYITDVGCLSDTAVKTISINPLPVAQFSTSLPLCETKAVTFTDQSSVAKGNVTKWHWSFGDNTDSLFVQSPTHTYAKQGNYNVSLIVESDGGCKSSVQTVPTTVNYQPLANFGAPRNCLDDGIATFTDSSLVGDNSTLIYKWDLNYGASPAGAYPTNANPQWHYTAVGNYQAKLTVTSNKGCTSDTIKSFTINGTVKQAKFAINNTNFCSNTALDITNTSQVTFGNLVKLEIWWDYNNDPSEKTTDDYPYSGKGYAHLYKSFTAASGEKSFAVHYKAYSGATCFDEFDTTIILKQTPVLAFDSLSPICQEASPIVLTAASNTDGFAGTAAYTGAGVVSGKTFDPRRAGVGKFPIKYTFVASNGCSADSTRFITVNPTPIVNVQPNITSLEGGTTLIPATASGNNLSYSWQPPTAMENSHTLTPTISPSNDITYTLTATSADGCTANTDINVKVLKYVKVPNAFSPNGDGIHDTWIITSLSDYPGCEVEVFNRYGQLVYRSVGYGTPWDGKFNGTKLPVGTYYWVIKPHNGRQPISGYVAIIM